MEQTPTADSSVVGTGLCFALLAHVRWGADETAQRMHARCFSREGFRGGEKARVCSVSPKRISELFTSHEVLSVVIRRLSATVIAHSNRLTESGAFGKSTKTRGGKKASLALRQSKCAKRRLCFFAVGF